ncbi:MAG: DegS sensor signal transduction histidine kinase [Firmicutes bacterium]|nr:DegS sensor signal transduction histidine kinase [Bacillota bacterium]
MMLNEFDNLVRNSKAVIINSKDDLAIFNQSSRKEVNYIEQELARVKQELETLQPKIDELLEKESQLQPRMLQIKNDISAFSSQEIKDVYEELFAVQVKLASAQEQKLSLQNACMEFESRLAVLEKNRENIGGVFSQIEKLNQDFDGMSDVVNKLQTLVYSQNFGLKIIKAQEEERRRVAREIHDGPAQAMANVIFLAEVCEKLLDKDTNRAKTELHELRQQVRGCLEETRKIIFDLRPMALDDLGLIPTVRRIGDMLRERTGLKVVIKVTGDQPAKLDPNVEVSLFRIIQESLNNIEKHADASEANILVDFNNAYVVAVIKDDGKGFEVKSYNYGNSFGLLGMKERVSLLNGELDINSQKGTGTEVSVKIPLPLTKDGERVAV